MADPNDDLSLSAAIEATEHLTLRELATHVHVGPLPIGIMTPLTLPLKEFFVPMFISFFVFSSLLGRWGPCTSSTPCFFQLSFSPLPRINPNSPAIKHVVDIVYDVDPNLVNANSLKAIIRDQA